MIIPRYWAKGQATGTDRHGKQFSISRWGWSNQNENDAELQGRRAAQTAVDRIQQGMRLDSYWYGQRTLREEILQEYCAPSGRSVAVITRNAYGCEVLNSPEAMFIDLDQPEIPLTEKARSFFDKLTGKSDVSASSQAEMDILTKTHQFIDKHPNWGFRVYRTFAGFRCLATHTTFDPSSEQVNEILQTLDSDPLYIRLCQAQKSFRARLTPKPWRCGHHANIIQFPHQNKEADAEFDKWIKQYQQRIESFATCRLIAIIGNARIHNDLQIIVDIHDQRTRAATDMRLA